MAVSALVQKRQPLLQRKITTVHRIASVQVCRQQNLMK